MRIGILALQGAFIERGFVIVQPGAMKLAVKNPHATDSRRRGVVERAVRLDVEPRPERGGGASPESRNSVGTRASTEANHIAANQSVG
jgi:hypothetical protein